VYLLDLIQIADSGFPSGSYAHSLGLEALYGEQEVDLEAHCRFLLSSGMSRVELPMVRHAYLAADALELRELDALMDVLLPVREFRMASRSVGRSFLRAVDRVRPSRISAEHHAVVFGAVLNEWQIDFEDPLTVYAWQGLRQQLSAAQRLGKIGQSAMQDLLHRLKPAISAAVNKAALVSTEEMGSFAPMLDLAGMRHEHQHTRLFLS
jgi:urease accessory protein